MGHSSQAWLDRHIWSDSSVLCVATALIVSKQPSLVFHVVLLVHEGIHASRQERLEVRMTHVTHFKGRTEADLLQIESSFSLPRWAVPLGGQVEISAAQGVRNSFGWSNILLKPRCLLLVLHYRASWSEIEFNSMEHHGPRQPSTHSPK